MKKLLTLICLICFTLPSFANIEDIINLNNSNKNRNTQKIEITHDKPTYVEHGKYTYKYNKNGDLLSLICDGMGGHLGGFCAYFIIIYLLS